MVQWGTWHPSIRRPMRHFRISKSCLSPFSVPVGEARLWLLNGTGESRLFAGGRQGQFVGRIAMARQTRQFIAATRFARRGIAVVRRTRQGHRTGALRLPDSSRRLASLAASVSVTHFACHLNKAAGGPQSFLEGDRSRGADQRDSTNARGVTTVAQSGESSTRA